MKLERGEQPASEALEDADVLEAEERAIRCAACGARVTSESARIAMNGAHEHEVMNPAGIRFSVQCFGEAPGCAAAGEPSTVWTWFPGFAWRMAMCRSCGVHLGWSFHGESRAFYGLVKDRLAP